MERVRGKRKSLYLNKEVDAIVDTLMSYYGCNFNYLVNSLLIEEHHRINKTKGKENGKR